MTTNREWLESLDNEEFAGAIGVVGRDCETCPAARECGNARNGDDCAHSFAKWLEEEHDGPVTLDEEDLRSMNGQIVFIRDLVTFALVEVSRYDEIRLYCVSHRGYLESFYYSDIKKYHFYSVETNIKSREGK